MKELNGSIAFTLKNDGGEYYEIMKLCSNGDIFVKGKLIENDKELVEAMREFVAKANPDPKTKGE